MLKSPPLSLDCACQVATTKSDHVLLSYYHSNASAVHSQLPMTPRGHFGANVILVISFNAIYVCLLAGNQTPTVHFVISIYYFVQEAKMLQSPPGGCLQTPSRS